MGLIKATRQLVSAAALPLGLLICHVARPPCLRALEQISSIQANGSLTEIESSCSRSQHPVCLVTVSTHQTIDLPGPHTTPLNLRLRFTSGGMWDVRGGPLTLSSGQLDAPNDTQIFSATSSIRGLSNARPEWFAPPSPEGYPPLALAQAYRATTSQGTILLRSAIYLSPFFDPLNQSSCLGKTLPYKTPRKIIGTTRPGVDDQKRPTRLIDGTIIRGELCGWTALTASHLGFDVGPFVVENLFDGHASYGIVLGRTGPIHQTKGTSLTDISVLTSNLPSQHSVIVEGQDDLFIQGLWIWTRGGTHGLVIKSTNVILRDFHCKGASSDCLIIKSDAATDNAGYASNVLLEDLSISALEHPGDTAGIVIDSRWDSVHHLTMNHILEDQTSYGINASGSIFHSLHDVSITNWTANVSGFCLNLDYSQLFTVERFHCTVAGSPSTSAAFLIKGDKTLLRDGTIACGTEALPCSSGIVDGVVDVGTETTLDHISGHTLTGFLVRNRPSQGENLRALATSAMGNRLVSRYNPPLESLSDRLHRWIAIAKPDLRILYTAAITRCHLLWAWLQSRLQP